MSADAPEGSNIPVVVLVYGESPNDTKAISELIQALCPELEGLVEWRREPPVLIKGVNPENAPTHAQRLADAVAGEETQYRVLCVFAHEDCDAVEPAHEAVGAKIEAELQAAGLTAHAVVPAWEMETWLMQWPEALEAFNQRWSGAAELLKHDLGGIVDAKEALISATRGSGPGHRRGYKVVDAPKIARLVRQMNLASSPAGSSASYTRFRESVAECCEEVGAD